MSKDYKPLASKPAAKPEASKTPAQAKAGGKGSPLMIGVLIGLLVGIALSVGVVLSVKNSGNPFQEKARPVAEIPADDSVKPDKKAAPATSNQPAPDSGQISSDSQEPASPASTGEAAGNQAAAKNDKKEDRFTFYGILTENAPPAPIPEPAKPDNASAAAPPASPGSASAPGTPKPVSERYFLQVGAYKTEQDADNAKAKLSLIGLDAVLQTVNLPNKGVLHRVRVGPIAGQEELNRVKAELTRNGFNGEPVKVQE